VPRNNGHRRELVSAHDFLTLSGEFSYLLSANKPPVDALVSLILGPSHFEGSTLPLATAVEFVLVGYGKRRRKLGPLAVLHPLRTAALLTRCMDQPLLLDLLGALLHDWREDLLDREAEPDIWTPMNDKLAALDAMIGSEDRWFLGERMPILTRSSNRSYYQYLGDILDAAKDKKRDVMHVKLADRLDNTLDTQVGCSSAMDVSFFRNVFDILFVPGFRGVHLTGHHFMPGRDEGVLLLAQLLKNAVFLSLVRTEKVDRADDATRRLFQAVAVAGMRQAQWIAMEVLSSHITGAKEQRGLLDAAMDYCQAGGISAIDSPGAHPLAGTFVRYASTSERDGKVFLGTVYDDKKHLALLCVVLNAVFSAFLNDPDYHLLGVTREGPRPTIPPPA
jgi:hypothetical protein